MDMKQLAEMVGTDDDGVTRYKQADASREKPLELTESKAVRFAANKESTRTKIITNYRSMKGIVIKKEPVKEAVKRV